MGFYLYETNKMSISPETVEKQVIYNAAKDGQITVEELSVTTFSNKDKRAEFLSGIDALSREPGFVWYWYGFGNNGKTTMINVLEHKFTVKRVDPHFRPLYGMIFPTQFLRSVRVVSESEYKDDFAAEFFNINDTTIIITNTVPNVVPSDTIKITHFAERF